MSEMSPSYQSLDGPAVLFAHRGARAHAPENTIEAFTLALRLGATGLESDVWVTSDGVAVLDHDGVVGGLLRRKQIADVARADLPEHIPTLEDLYTSCGSAFELSLDVKDPAVVDEVLRVATTAGALEHLWLCHPDIDLLGEWRKRSAAPKLVNSTRMAALEHGAERRAAQLRERGIDALNMHHSEWSAGTVALLHRFQRHCFGWDAQHLRVIRSLLDMGIDGVYSDHVDRLVDAAAV